MGRKAKYHLINFESEWHPIKKDKCLLIINPKLASEWHHVKNGELTPNDVKAHSGKKVWWLCSKGHEWLASVDSRSRGCGCPLCYYRSSEIELLVYSEMKYIFSNTKHRYKIQGMECDVYISEINLAIECDGWYWHKDRLQKDKDKNKKLEKIGIKIIRLREGKLRRINNDDIKYIYDSFNMDKVIKIIHKVIKSILNNDIDEAFKIRLKKYLKEKKLMNYEYFLILSDMLPSPLLENSLAYNKPNLVLEWHPIKNGKLTPWDVTTVSGKRVWWLCSKGHEWNTRISTRSSLNSGCPYCTHRVVCEENCLAVVNPKLASEWHSIKNGKLTSHDVNSSASKKVWWICCKKHEWEATINGRASGKLGCPYCAGKKVCVDNCLSTTHPELLLEWNYIKNKDITPNNITFGSNKKVWWVCKNNKKHEWQAEVNNRSNGKGYELLKNIL